MQYEEKRPRQEAADHHVILEGRASLSVSGVEEVESFDENAIVMRTSLGTLVVRGEELHIEKLSLDGGDLRVEGMVEAGTAEYLVIGNRPVGGNPFRLTGSSETWNTIFNRGELAKATLSITLEEYA